MKGTLTSEWTKARTLRSTAWTLPATVVAAGVLAALVSLMMRSIVETADEAIFATFYALTLAQLPLVVFGVLLVGGEYSSGTIRASLLATPRRHQLLAGKVLTGGMVAAATAALTVAAAILAARPVLGSHAPSLTEADMLRATVGGWLYLTLICLFAIGVATMLRSSAAALGVLLPVLFLGSQGLGNIPGVRTITQFLPDTAGTMIIHLSGPPDDPTFDRVYGPWTGTGILALWALAALVGGYLVLRHRDA